MPAAGSTHEALADSDAELAHRVALGDTRAFEQIMRRYNRALFRTARAILRDDGLAEDAVQEAYMRAYGAIGSFRGESKLSTWLIRIVANEALARRRKDQRRAQILPIHGGDEEERGVEQGMDEPKGRSGRPSAARSGSCSR